MAESFLRGAWGDPRPYRDRLDATTDTIMNSGALFSIGENAQDYRAIICVRNQLERTVSSFGYCKDVHPRKIDEQLLREHEFKLQTKIPGAETKFADGTRIPRHFRNAIRHGHYLFSSVGYYNYEGDEAEPLRTSFDSKIERFMRRSFTAQLAYEAYHLRTKGTWPLVLSVLAGSFYTSPIRRVLTILDPRKVMVVSSNRISGADSVRHHLSSFLNLEQVDAGHDLRSVNVSDGRWVKPEEVNEARRLLAEPFDEDTRNLLSTLRQYPEVDLSLFDPSSLFTAPSLSEV
ncbi:MAG: hypothetical protein WDN29_08270 [Methylovirgula sp.]